jgi:predicted porin
MKKTIIASAIAAVVAAPAAFADVSVYGKAHMAVNQKDMGAGGTDVDSISSNASRFGVKASEDLGNGMKAFVAMEWGTDTLDGGSSQTVSLSSAGSGTATVTEQFTARDATVGISGDFGKVAIGRMGGPHKGTLYAVGNVQLADANGGADFAGGFDSKGGRVSNALAYSNSFNGVDLTIATVGNDTTDNFDDTAISLTTTVGGVQLSAANLNQSGTDDDITIVGAKFGMGGLTVGVVYEEVDDATNDTDTMGVSASYAMGNNVLSLSASSRDFQTAGTADTDRMAVGFEHKLGKKTSIYASYADVDTGTTSTSYDITSVGMIMSF